MAIVVWSRELELTVLIELILGRERAQELLHGSAYVRVPWEYAHEGHGDVTSAFKAALAHPPP